MTDLTNIDLSDLEQALKANALSERDAKNFEGSAHRVQKMYRELSWSPERIAEVINAELHKVFPCDDGEENGMLVQGPIRLDSMCPHHFMPVRYHAYIGYLPKDGRVLGLSKISRVPEALSKQFVLQEQLAKYLADAFFDMRRLPEALTQHLDMENYFESHGSIVSLVGVHTCMSCRGVRSDARTVVTERRGAFREGNIEARFNQQVQFISSTQPFGK